MEIKNKSLKITLALFILAILGYIIYYFLAPAMVEGSIYDFTLPDHKNNDIKIESFKGKKIIFVNVASKCGLAKASYTRMNEIIKKHKGKVIFLLFPAQHMLNQEYDNIEDTLKYAKSYLVDATEGQDYILFSMIEVIGKNKHPLYKLLTSKLPGFIFNAIKWNFTAFLADEEGNLIKRYGPKGFIEVDDKRFLSK